MTFRYMIAALGRYLHQPIDAVLEWSADEFMAFYDTMAAMLKAERGGG